MYFERLSELCEEHNTNVTNLLKELGLSTSKTTAWKHGTMPKGDTLVKVANYFNVSTDYLLGNTDIRKCDVPEDTALDLKKRRELDLLKKIDPELLPEVVKFAQYLQSQRDE